MHDVSQSRFLKLLIGMRGRSIVSRLIDESFHRDCPALVAKTYYGEVHAARYVR